MTALVEGILPDVSMGHATEARLGIVCVPDPSESTIHAGRRLHERLSAESVAGLQAPGEFRQIPFRQWSRVAGGFPTRS